MLVTSYESSRNTRHAHASLENAVVLLDIRKGVRDHIRILTILASGGGVAAARASETGSVL